MAVPDWPNTYGYNMFYFPFSQWIGGIFWEHSHRLVASLVGFFTLILAIWAHGRVGRVILRYLLFPLFAMASLVVLLSIENNTMQHVSILGGTAIAALVSSFFWPCLQPAPSLVRKLSLLALFLVIFQGLLGGLRVTLFKDEIGIFHATLAQLFFVLTLILAFVASRSWNDWKPAIPSSIHQIRIFSVLMSMLCALVIVQLALGAYMRHQHAGLAVTGFPLAYDTHLWPPSDQAFVDRLNAERIDLREFEPVTAVHIHVHMMHRILALFLFLSSLAFLIWVNKRLGHRHMLARSCTVWFGLLCIQGLLGAATVWSNKAADIATAHVLIGALTLAHASFMVIAARRSIYLAGKTRVAMHATTTSRHLEAREIPSTS